MVFPYGGMTAHLPLINQVKEAKLRISSFLRIGTGIYLCLSIIMEFLFLPEIS
jgi:hypothetical protein